MDAIVSSGEDRLIDSLSFKLQNPANYVSQRRNTTFYPSQGEISTTGVRVAKITLADDSAWLDPQTVNLFFTLTNTDGTNALKPITTDPSCLFRRVRVMSNGVLLHDIDDFNRMSQMFNLTKPLDRQSNDETAGFLTTANLYVADTLDANASITVSFKPKLGILEQDRYIPLKFCNLTFEFELSAQVADILDTTSPYSSTFKLSNITLKADLVHLDDGLMNQYTEYLMEGKTLPIPFTNYMNSSQTLTEYQGDIKVSRALSKLRALYVNLYDKTNAMLTQSLVNAFSHPMAGIYDYTKELSYQISIGSRSYPEYPVQSASESFQILKKVLNKHHGDAALGFSKSAYLTDSFIMATDFEKVLNNQFSGKSTNDGQLLNIKLRSANGSVVAKANDSLTIYYTLEYDSILNIGLNGCSVVE